MSIFEAIFGTKPATTQPNTSAGAGTSTTNPDPGIKPDPNAANLDPNKSTTPVSPLDAFKDLFQTTPIDPKAPAAPADPFAVDPNKVLEQARTVDFLKNSVTAEDMEKINAGGPEAMQAMLRVINRSNQTNYAYAAMLASQMAGKARQTASDQIQSMLPDLVRKLRTDEELQGANPALNHPAAKPLIQALIPQFAAKYPTASPAELHKQVVEYLTNFGKLFQTDETAGLKDKTKGGNGKQENSPQDWDLFLKS
jgi:hypothetical protein